MRVMAWPASGPNPYISLLYGNMPDVEVAEFEGPGGWLLREQQFDILHVHWPEAIYWVTLSFPRLVLRALRIIHNIRLARRRGVRVVWTAHNFKPHDFDWQRALIWFWYWPMFLRHVDACICLGETGKTKLLRECPQLRSRPIFVVPHGHYRSAYPNSIARSAARARLDIPPGKTVLAFFGSVRRYKDVTGLISCFRELRDREIVLLVAGRPEPPNMKDVVGNAAAGDTRIRLDLRFIPDDEVQYFLNAADLVVLPFAEILNSGSALLALSFDRPLYCPAKGALTELQNLVGADWVKTYDGSLTASGLQQAIAWTHRQRRAATAPLQRLDWALIARQTYAVYRKTMVNRP